MLEVVGQLEAESEEAEAESGVEVESVVVEAELVVVEVELAKILAEKFIIRNCYKLNSEFKSY
jgi:hypothetical protein